MHSGNHHNRHVGVTFLGLLQQADAIHPGHHQVGKHELELLARVQQGKRLQAGSCLTALVVSGHEHGGNDLADGVFVVDYKDTFRGHEFGLESTA